MIQVDSREQRALFFGDHQVEVVKLDVGDYGLRGFSDWLNPAFICERKSVDDLVHSLIKDQERFWKEVLKMRQFRFAAILVECCRERVAEGGYVSAAKPQCVLAMLDAIIVRCGIHVFWCGSPEGAAAQFLSLARQFCRGIEKDAKKLEVGGV
jgi:ERCC4-type nuclease